MTMEELNAMQDLDVREIDPATVPDISQIQIDTGLPPEQRMAGVLQQMNGNPYFYRSGGLVVKTVFRGAVRLQTLLEECLEKA